MKGLVALAYRDLLMRIKQRSKRTKDLNLDTRSASEQAPSDQSTYMASQWLKKKVADVLP